MFELGYRHGDWPEDYDLFLRSLEKNLKAAKATNGIENTSTAEKGPIIFPTKNFYVMFPVRNNLFVTAHNGTDFRMHPRGRHHIPSQQRMP